MKMFLLIYLSPHFTQQKKCIHSPRTLETVYVLKSTLKESWRYINRSSFAFSYYYKMLGVYKRKKLQPAAFIYSRKKDVKLRCWRLNPSASLWLNEELQLVIFGVMALLWDLSSLPSVYRDNKM